jgi:hypothetical protein
MIRAIGTTALLLAMFCQEAQAQTYYNQQQFGNQRFYNGQMNGQPFNGNSQTFGNQTYSNFNSGGQTTNCTTQRFGSMVTTNCY